MEVSLNHHILSNDAQTPMEIWKKITLEGNQSYNKGRIYSAESCYKTACYFAAEISPEDSSYEDMIASLVISYQNLAELYFSQKKIELALTQYQQVHKLLIKFYLQHSELEAMFPMLQQTMRKLGTELLAKTNQLNINTESSKHIIATLTGSLNFHIH